MDDLGLFDFLGVICVLGFITAASLAFLMLAAVLLRRLSGYGEATESGVDPDGLLSSRALVCATVGIMACIAALAATQPDAELEYWAAYRRLVAALLIGVGVMGVTWWTWARPRRS